MILRRYTFILFTILFCTPGVCAQSVYKTPSGDRYHLSTCKHVNNVSKRMTVEEAINEHYLQPCKICKPPVPINAVFLHSGRNKAVGACTAVRCQGKTQSKARCKRKTKLCNGFCFQHNPDK